ncbi:MAG: hypothetical protein ACREX1_00560, partial [Advenella sp.]
MTIPTAILANAGGVRSTMRSPGNEIVSIPYRFGTTAERAAHGRVHATVDESAYQHYQENILAQTLYDKLWDAHVVHQ